MLLIIPHIGFNFNYIFVLSFCEHSPFRSSLIICSTTLISFRKCKEYIQRNRKKETIKKKDDDKDGDKKKDDEKKDELKKKVEE